MRISIGTAQFGLNYGVCNPHGRVSFNEIEKIFDYANIIGINKLDTAISYGDSVNILNSFDISSFEITNKINISQSHINSPDQLYNEISEFSASLKQAKAHNLLIHNPDFLTDPFIKSKVFKILSQCKSEGLINKIGLSIYSPTDLDSYFEEDYVDIVQLPFNIFDTRLLRSKWFFRLKDKKVELQARSIFLQGLLLCKANELPKKFLHFSTDIEKLNIFCKKFNLSRLELSLIFVQNLDDFNSIIVGVNSFKQLTEIVHAAHKKVNFNKDELIQSLNEIGLHPNKSLIDPRSW